MKSRLFKNSHQSALFLSFCALMSLLSCISDKKPAPIKKASENSIDNGQANTGPGSVEDIIRSCGLDPKVYSDPNGLRFEQNLRGLTKKISGTKIIVSYAIVIQPSLAIRVTNALGTQNTDIKLVSASSTLAATVAEGQLKEKRGVTTSKPLAQTDLTDLKTKNQEWSTITCSVSPSAETTAPNGLKLKFDPGLPNSVSPIAQPQVYAQELGEGKDFTINATVEIPGSSGLTAGQKVSGRVSIKKVSPIVNINDQVSGQNRTVQGDIAYQVTPDFGGAEMTKKLGLGKRTYVIDHSRRNFKLVIAEQGEPEFDPIIFESM